MPVPSNLSFVGVAKETTKGTGAVPTAYIPVTTLDPSDELKKFEDTGMRGAMVDVYDLIDGPRYSEVSLAGNVHPDTIPWLLANHLGDLATTGASAPYTHAMAAKNSGDGQPGAISLTDHYGLTGVTPARRFAGSQVSELTFKWAGDGMFDWTAKTIGFASEKVAKPTQSFGVIPPYAGWVGTLAIGGSSKAFMQSGELSLRRLGAAPIDTVDGSAAPYAIWMGPVEAAGKLTFVHEDDTELDRFLAGTSTTLALLWTQGTSAALTEVSFTMSKVKYRVARVKRGKQFVELEVDYKALANTTDVGASGGYSPLKAVVKNAVASGVYA